MVFKHSSLGLHPVFSSGALLPGGPPLKNTSRAPHPQPRVLCRAAPCCLSPLWQCHLLPAPGSAFAGACLTLPFAPQM